MSFYLKTRAIDSGAATIGILRSFRLFKEVLWVSVGQLAAELQAVKVGCLIENSVACPKSNHKCLA